MGLVVNTNMSSLNAQRTLDASGVTLSRSLQRLSSGLRINSASDDAAGLAIATRMNSQVRAVNQAIRNANDGMAMLQTAEGAMSEVTNIVTRIKELAVQSANGSNSSTDRTSLNDELNALVSEVTRIATQTKFGGQALLDGSFNGVFQVGAETGQTVSQTVANFKASSLTGSVASQALTLGADVSNLGAVNASTYLGIDGSTDLQISGPKGAAFVRQTVAGDDTASFVQGSASAIALAKVVNESTASTGVTATVSSAVFTSTDLATQFANTININSSDADHTVKINGQTLTVNINGGSVAIRRQQFIDAVNTQISGVVASTNGTNGITLTAADGRNISVQANGIAANTAGLELFGFSNTSVATEKVVARGGITLQAAGAITTTDGTNAGAASSQLSGEGTASASSTALSTLSVSSVANANTAMFVADAILDTISSERGKLGATQNRLAATIANLGTVAEKVSDAKSRIMDADFAAETANLTKAQILQQAGIAMLAQANSRPQAVLQLLQG
jgi:flagellin